MSLCIPGRESYPSDVTDEQWSRLAHWIPPEKPRGRHRETDVREVINAINYRWTTGCAWRMLPHDFPVWTTVYTYFRRWQLDGTLSRLREELLKPKPRRRKPADWPETTNPQPPPTQGTVPAKAGRAA